MGERRRDRKQRKLTIHQTNQQALYAQAQMQQTQALIAQQNATNEMLRAQLAAQQQQAATGGGAWHPDPVGRFNRGWWNGAAWTDKVCDAAGNQMIDPQPINTVR